MKKHSALLRASGILLVLTLGTSCLVGGTFAKYVTKGTGKDTARVAKWGVEVEVTGDGFLTSYGKDDSNFTIPNGGPSVKGDGSESITFTWNSNGASKEQTEEVSNVLAPGTEGTFGGVKITGEPEVAVEVETTANVVLTGWNVGGNRGDEFYCPLVFTIGDKTIKGLDYSSDTAGGEYSFENAIETAIQDATTKVLEAGTDLSTVGNNITYSWEWPFENANGTVASQDDELDTLLGNNAVGDSSEEIPAVLITVTTTVTQID
nr:hypothetical protein [uncultured Gemmiger sp.]